MIVSKRRYEGQQEIGFLCLIGSGLLFFRDNSVA